MVMAKPFPLLIGCILFIAVAAHAAAPVTTNSNGGSLFQFKFDPNKPLTYAVEIKNSSMNDNETGQRSTLTRTTTANRYRVRLTAMGTNADGTTSVYFEPYAYEFDYHSTGPGGDIDSYTRNLDVQTRQNGIVMVDTQKGVGMEQWQSLRQAVYPHLLSGYMDFDRSGHIVKYEGDLPFIDYWQHQLQYTSNLFYIVFPTNAVAITDTWTNDYNFKTAGPVVFDGNGLAQVWSYTRGPDQATSNGPAASFTLYSSTDLKDLTGYTDHLGQRNSVEVPEHVASMNASFLFDQKRGCLVSLTESESAHEDLNMVIQGNSATGHNESESSISITLVPPDH